MTDEKEAPQTQGEQGNADAKPIRKRDELVILKEGLEGRPPKAEKPPIPQAFLAQPTQGDGDASGEGGDGSERGTSSEENTPD